MHLAVAAGSGFISTKLLNKSTKQSPTSRGGESTTLRVEHLCSSSVLAKQGSRSANTSKFKKNWGWSIAWGRFHQYFTSTFCANFLAPKNYKPKPYAQKSCSKDFCTKKLLIKCWWNWHLDEVGEWKKRGGGLGCDTEESVNRKGKEMEETPDLDRQ